MIYKNIPNTITILNLLSGTLSIIFAIEEIFSVSALLIFVAAVFDFLDGLSARLLNAYSEMGKQLDSLADVISFGLAPGILVLSLQKLFLFGENVSVTELATLNVRLVEWILLLCPILLPVCAALRLSKFNLDKRQTSTFAGLPTPANAIFFASLALMPEYGRYGTIDEILLHPPILALFVGLMSLLMVSKIPILSLKFTKLKWKENKVRFIFLVMAGLAILSLSIYGIAFSVFLLISLSLITTRLLKRVLKPL